MNLMDQIRRSIKLISKIKKACEETERKELGPVNTYANQEHRRMMEYMLSGKKDMAITIKRMIEAEEEKQQQ